MPIELRCPSCNQQLRVPDTAAGKNARCPKCSTIVSVPNASAAAPPPAGPPPGAPFGTTPPASLPTSSPPPSSFGAPPASPFGANPPAAPSPFGFGPPQPQPGGGGFGGNSPNPFASNDLGAGFNPQSGGFAPNPYASPAPVSDYGSVGTGKIQPTPIDVGTIFNRATKLWQDHMGILLGATVVYFLILIVLGIGLGLVQAALVVGGKAALILGGIVLQVVMAAPQAYLTAGYMQLCFRLCRGQQADIGALFGAGGQFLPVYLYVLLLSAPGIVVQVIGQVAGAPFDNDAQMLTAVLQIGVGLFMAIAMLFIWPVYSLLVDGRCSFGDAFGLAIQITNGNKLTSFLLAILTFLVMVAGVLALCIGIIFALPLTFMVWAVAYLMMSGQISQHQHSNQPYQQPMYR